MKLESSVLKNEKNIPVEYTCDSSTPVRIPLSISEVPENTKSLALIVDDPDAPNGDFVHWVIWNINPDVTSIESDKLPDGGQEGYNGLGKLGWVPPCPPSGIHHYYFRLYSLDIALDIESTSTKADLIHEMEKHIIDESILIGIYGKN